LLWRTGFVDAADVERAHSDQARIRLRAGDAASPAAALFAGGSAGVDVLRPICLPCVGWIVLNGAVVAGAVVYG